MTGNVVSRVRAGRGAGILAQRLTGRAGRVPRRGPGRGSLNGRLGRDRGLLLRAGAAAELVLVAGALVLTPWLITAAARDGTAALLALAMGIQNAVARRLAVRISPPPCSP